MVDTVKMGAFLASRRRTLGMTQQQVAARLCISFQAVSRWETGAACPNTELLPDLAALLQVTIDELLAGQCREEGLSYQKAGVDISYTDAIKTEMRRLLQTPDSNVLNGVGPFASLYDFHFPEMERPVLVLKSEEPGSKQKLALEYGYTDSICRDLINHLVNDIAVMGAKPLAVLDTIICGNPEKDTICSLVRGMAEACRENDCSLVGGETSVQPQVVERGTYILTASIAGVADRKALLDGSAIRPGDVVLAIASNGLHTNGYSLVRMMLDRSPRLKLEQVAGEPFLCQLMKPHTAYYPMLRQLRTPLHGMAHITGGGIEGNLCRIIPEGCSARIQLNQIRPLPVFSFIKQQGNIPDAEMLSTFNCGVGLILVAPAGSEAEIIRQLAPFASCYPIGEISQGEGKIVFSGEMHWPGW